MANLTKSYETVFVLSNKLTEDATAELVKTVSYTHLTLPTT